MADIDSSDNSKIGVQDRFFCALYGFLYGFIISMLFLGVCAMSEITGGLEWISWPKAIVIALLTPGTLGIIAICNADKLIRFFRSRFWRRTSRIALGFVGVVFSVIGIILLRDSLVFALFFLFFGISILWSVFRGADKDISEWWETLSWWD